MFDRNYLFDWMWLEFIELLSILVISVVPRVDLLASLTNQIDEDVAQNYQRFCEGVFIES